MKYFLITLIAIFIVTTAGAQMTDPSVTNKQAQAAQKSTRKEARQKKYRGEVAKNENEERFETRPKYKKTIKRKKRKLKENNIPITPSKTTDY